MSESLPRIEALGSCGNKYGVWWQVKYGKKSLMIFERTYNSYVFPTNTNKCDIYRGNRYDIDLEGFIKLDAYEYGEFETLIQAQLRAFEILGWKE